MKRRLLFTNWQHLWLTVSKLDSTGNVTYFPRCNLMGDVTALLDINGNVVVKMRGARR